MLINTHLKKLFSLFLILFCSFVTAGQKAITDDGKVVILNDDKTWRFEKSEANIESGIKLNNKQFFVASGASFVVKALPTNMGVMINPENWSFAKDPSDSNKMVFKSKKNSDVYGMVISEGIEVDAESLTFLALENAKKIAPDAQIIKKEYRMVNGNKIIYMEIEGSFKSIKFRYAGYYTSNSSGSIQVITYSTPKIMISNTPLYEELLNGLIFN